MNPMASKSLNDVLERARAWPDEDQEELAGYAREIEARRTGVYVLTAEEETAVEEGLTQLGRGEFVAEEEMAKVWKRFGVT
jgi:hypothetical protein